MRMVAVHFLGTPAVSDVVQRNFDDLHVRVVDPRALLFIKPDVER